MSKSKRDRNPSEAYNHLAPHSTRTLGNVRSGEEVVSPSHNIRTLEQAIPSASVQSIEVYDGWDEKKQKARYKTVQPDVVAHARQEALGRANRHPVVTDGHRQKFQKRTGDESNMGMSTPCCAPVAFPLSGGNKRRY